MRRRVTFVLPSLHGGGAERAAVTLLNGLIARDYQATLFVFAKEGPYFDQLESEVRVVVGEQDRAGRLTSLRRFLANERQSAVVSFLSHFSTYAAVRWADLHTKFAISQQTPLTAFLADRDYDWRHPVRRRIFNSVARTVYPRADGIAATSHGVADDLVRNFGVQRSRVSIVPNPVDVRAVERAALEPIDAPLGGANVPTIVTAGRLAHAKNLPLLVASLERLAKRFPFRAWVLGQGELESDLRAMLANAGLSERVTLLGFQKNPWKFMARGDVFLLTSHYEGFGNVLIEAMACGLPVVATASYGTRDIVHDRMTGLLVERHEPEAVADAVARLFTDTPLRRELAARVRARAAEYSVENVVDRFDAFLEKLLNG